MILLPQSLVRYFCSVVLVLLLSQVAICKEDSSGINANQTSSISVVSTNSSTSSLDTANNGTKHDDIESITKQKLSSEGFPVDLPENTTKASLSHDNIPSNTGLSDHSADATVSATQLTLNSTASSVTNSTSSLASNSTSLTTSSSSYSSSIIPTVPALHRKSKPEETTVDEIVQDSGPTTDYVVPLVVAMLAVPLVGVLCALLYMKGRDFWERRHYGRIDFLWDSRNDSRMDFLIDGMYNN